MSQALPPYATLLGIALEDHADAPPVLVMPFGDDVLGRPGFLHGGAIAGLLELAAIAALRQALAADGGGRIEPVTHSIDFMRGGRDRPTRARGRIGRLGTRIANVEAVAWQDDESRPIAAARTTWLIVRPAAGS
ncbi:PaaI family thioesterase [Sphingomonas sp. GC_Shp_1]|uniref:PaaI family thioesterase n=1 Tax=unclassified Sphingomonas TaxID=196159 RepID=UPI00226A9CBE